MAKIEPHVHINGTDGNELLEQWKNVMDAAKVLEKALHDATPHGRDYYIMGPEPFINARGAHIEMLESVAAISKVAMETAIGISNQMGVKG